MKIYIYLFLVCFLSYSLAHSQIKYVIKPEKQQYHLGEKIKVYVATSSPLPENAWLGLFKATVPNGSTSGYESYQYVQGKTEITMEFEAPVEPAKYQFRLFDNDPGKELKAVDIGVNSIDPKSISIKIVSSSIKPAQPFTVEVKTQHQLNSSAWLGIFKSKQQHGHHNNINNTY